MDENCSGDYFRGSSQKHSSVESSVSASVSNAAASENSRRSRKTGAAAVETNAAKRKRVSRVTTGGLRQFSAMVRDKLESKGSTTYAEVADDIVSDLSGNDSQTAISLSEDDAKNIRRRVYDALNVLEAMDIITREKKQIKWKGNPDRNTIEGMKAECFKLTSRIGKKTTYLKDLEEQIADLQNLMVHNKQLLESANTKPEGFSLPFILAQTSSDATLEIEISEDMQMVHFDFNSTPFSLHDDTTIMKLLRSHQEQARATVSQTNSVYSSPRAGITASGGTRPFYWISETDTRNSKVKKR